MPTNQPTNNPLSSLSATSQNQNGGISHNNGNGLAMTQSGSFGTGSYSAVPSQHHSSANGVVGGLGSGTGNLLVQGSAGGHTQQKPIFFPWTIDDSFPSHLFTSGAPLWPGLTADNVEWVHFYLTLWREIKKPDPLTHGIITTRHSTNHPFLNGPDAITLFFTTEEKQQEFLKFHHWYEARFGKDFWRTKYFPSLEHGKKVDGYVVKATFPPLWSWVSGQNPGSIPNFWFYEWKWIVERTYDTVLHSDGYWIFGNETEMLMFSMKDAE